MTNMYKQSKAILETDAERRNAEEGTKIEVPKSQEVNFGVSLCQFVMLLWHTETYLIGN